MKSQRLSGGREMLSSGILLPGRRECMCEARDHTLINNCTNCGRIVCQQEGSGPCFTCNNLVCTNAEREVLNRDSKASAKLREKLLGDTSILYKKTQQQDSEKINAQLYKAIEHKNKLLEFNDTATKRTKVIDDESDYYNMDCNKWLSAPVRKAFEEKIKEREEVRHGSRLNKPITFDFAGRIIEDSPYDDESYIEELLKDDISIFEHTDFVPTANLSNYIPEYSGNTPSNHVSRKLLPEKNSIPRIQDKELQFMSDDGMCLSINQPYASLIVRGIKTHEGRNWYTSYRGRLWIHASQKPPPKVQIDEVQNTYRHLKGDDIQFPLNYSLGAVIGCVDVVDCLTQEEYRERYPNGEIASPLVFICENPQELKLKIPMKGGKKIFKMERSFHNAVKKALQKMT